MLRFAGIVLIVALCSCGSEVRTGSLPPAAIPLTDWSVPGHRAGVNLYAGDLVLGYADGFLIANRVSDGSEAWRRLPDHPVLGVTFKGDALDTDGIPLVVVPGTCAAAAGFATDDVLLSFDGHETRNFMRDLRKPVLDRKPGDPFTAMVRRGGKALMLTGIMGGEPVEPVQANRTSVMVWPRGVNWRVGPDIPITVHDLQSGQRLVRYQLAPDLNDREHGLALLTPHDILLAIEARELIGLPVRGNADPDQVHPLWRLPLPAGIPDLAGQVHLLSDDLLWMPDSMEHHVAIVEVATGHVQQLIAEEPTASPLLAGHYVLCMSDNRVLSCWDIATGKQAWRGATEYSRLIAARGDSAYACDKGHHLVVVDPATGALRLEFNKEWVVFDDYLVDHDRLCLHVGTPSHAQSLVSIAATGGKVQWQHEVPSEAKIVELVLTPDAFGYVLGNPHGEEMLFLLSHEGKVSQSCSLRAQEDVIPTPGRAIASGPAGLRVLPRSPAEEHSP